MLEWILPMQVTTFNVSKNSYMYLFHAFDIKRDGFHGSATSNDKCRCENQLAWYGGCVEPGFVLFLNIWIKKDVFS
jgi:hypothetical protein